MELPVNQIMKGDALTRLKELPDQCVNMIMTSPPYWALRDYGTEGRIWDGDENCNHDFEHKERYLHRGSTKSTVQASVDKIGGIPTDWKVKDGYCVRCGAWKGNLGLEPTFEEYINHLCNIFDEVKRVLRKDGTCWVNIGDTYYGGGNNRGSSEENLSAKQKSNRGARGQVQMDWKRPSRDAFKQAGIKGNCLFCNKECFGDFCSRECLNKKGNDFRSQNRILPDKTLCNIPARFSIEMQNRGWILRNVIIWHKPNCMPSSVKDRFTVDFEYIFFFVKSKKYFFETQYEQISEVSKNDKRLDKGRFEYYGKRKQLKDAYLRNPPNNYNRMGNSIIPQSEMMGISSFGRNKRTVWKITTKPFKEAHFATYPEELCETPIKAGCPKGGIVLDMFFGSGTTGLVALKQNKKFIGIELNPKYIEIARKRLEPYLLQSKLFAKDEVNGK